MRFFSRPVFLASLGLALWVAPAANAEEPAPRTQVQEVIVVFKTHFDIGYTDTVDAVLESYRTTMIDRALQVCDETRPLPPEQHFVWTLPGWPMAWILGPDEQDASQRRTAAELAYDPRRILWPAQTPDRSARLLEAVRAGQLVWHALPFTTQTETLELEDLVRGLKFASDLSRMQGADLPLDAKMTDVPSHVWSLPTVLAHAGVKFLHLGCNAGSTPPEVPVLFWWEGPDGSRLLTMQSPAYGTDLVPPEDWPHTTWLALIHTNDNVGPPSPDDVRKVLAEAAEKLPDVKLRMGRLSDFAEALLKENPSLPVVRADMPDTWIHGFGASPVPTALSRQWRPRLAAAEALHTLLGAWGLPTSESAADRIAVAYEQSLLYGEHTWGLSRHCVQPRLYGQEWKAARAEGRYDACEQSWDDHHAYIENVRKLTGSLLECAGKTLASAVAVEGSRIVVFNPLPWRRDEAVSVAVDEPFDGSSLIDVESGEPVAFEEQEGFVRFIARDLPPMGYRTYQPRAGSGASQHSPLIADDATGTLENARFRVRLDLERGTIASLVDKRTGREFVDDASEFGLGQYLYERFDADRVNEFLQSYNSHYLHHPWVLGDFGKPDLPPASEVPYHAASPRKFSATFETGPVTASATMAAPADDGVPHAVALTVTLHRDMEYVDLTWSITDKQADSWPEAGWLCLPFKVQQPRFALGRLGCVVDPTQDLVPASNHHLFYLNTGMTVTDPQGVGIGICPIDAPMVSLDERGIWRFSRRYTPTRPIVLVSLFNNQWSTNFVQWIEGSWSSRVRLWPVAGEGLCDDLITPALETRQRSEAFAWNGAAGELPPARAGLELSRKGVQVTAFGANPDGPGVLLRLWEQAGHDEPCRILLPSEATASLVRPVDLRGRPAGERLEVEDGAFQVPMAPFAPTSLVLDLPR